MAGSGTTGHRQRLRDRFVNREQGSDSDEALLDMLLTYAIPQKDVLPLAKRLLAEYGDLTSCLDAPLENLCRIDGLKTHGASLIKLVNYIRIKSGHSPTADAHLAENNVTLLQTQSPVSIKKNVRKVGSGLFGKSLLKEAINILPTLPDTSSLEEIKKFLLANLRFNSGQTRERFASYIMRRTFPYGEADESMRYFAKAFINTPILNEVCFYRFIKVEPLELKIVEELLLPNIASGELESARIKQFIREEYPGYKDYDSYTQAVIEALNSGGIVKADAKNLSFAYRDIPIPSFAFILHSEFPEPGMFDIAKPIETTKATAIYNMHTYWSKKPHDAIREYIRHYTRPGDLVLDPFCGSGGTATTNYTVYSQVFECPRCLDKVAFFDCGEVYGETVTGKSKKISVCPHCYAKGIQEEISTRAKKFGSVPVFISYTCKNGCKPASGSRRHNDADEKKREYFAKYDLGKISEIEGKEIPYWYPKHRMMNVESDTEPWGDEWRPGRNFRTVAELFTKRNLWALAIIKNLIETFPDNKKYQLLFPFDACVLGVSKMVRSSNTATMPGTYYILQIAKEVKVFSSFSSKFDIATKGWKQIKNKNTSFMLSTQSSTQLDAIQSNTIDFIFTDPPYAEKIQYGELNFIWEAWLDFDTNWHVDEIIINETRRKTEENWNDLMESAMSECYRVLKPGRCISLCYHDTSEGTWTLVQDIMAKSGFLIENSDSALYIDAGQKSYNQTVADKVTKRDLVINFRKPKPGEVAAAVTLTGQEDAATFADKARRIIRDYLDANHGSTKDRVYDEVVSRMVRTGQMEAHDFEALLRQVADEITPEGEKGPGRWYLKETELTPADEAETACEDNAAAKAKARAAGLGRRVKRYIALLEAGAAIPEHERQSDATLAEWLRYCKRAGLFAQGKLLYEKGGLNTDNLTEEAMVGVEEDYQACVLMLNRESTASKKHGKKKER